MAAWQIPLQAQAPQIQTPTQVEGQQLTLKHMGAENALVQQQVQAAQMANQERQRDMQDQDIMRKAYMTSGGDMDKFQRDVMQAGASPRAITAVQQHILQTRETLGKIHEADLKVQQGHTQAIGSAAQGLLGMPDEQTRAAAWPTVRTELVNRGVVKPEEAPEQYPGADWVTFHRNSAVAAEKAIENTLNERKVKAEETTAAANKAKADAEVPGLKATGELKNRQLLVQGLRAAAGSQDTYREAWSKLTPEQQELPGVPDPVDYDPEKTPAALESLGMTTAEKARADTQRQRNTQRATYENARIAIQRQAEAFKEAHGGATPGQQGVQSRFNQRELDAISAEEDGKGTYPGLHAQRVELGQQLAEGGFVDKSGAKQTLDDDAKKVVEKRLNGLNDRLQKMQFRKARIYGFGVPDTSAVTKTNDGDTATAPDGSIWRKQDGILYFDSPPAPGSTAAPGKVAVPVNNPGNLKKNGKDFDQYGSPQEGWDDLRSDLGSKIAGKTAHGLTADSTIQELANVYAPKGDGNNKPEDWAKNVASYLKVSPKTPIGNYADRLDDLAQAVAFAEGSKIPFVPAKSAKPASAPQTAAPPAAAPAPAAPAAKMTEADARQRAKAAGKDPEWYVAELRKRNLLQ